jgi:predicted Zn-dependent protease
MIAAVLAAMTLLSAQASDGYAQARKKSKAPSIPLIRDAEIEGLMRLYARPIFKAAGLNPNAVKVYLIRDDKINAFVAGGQRMFIHTGLLMRTKAPNEVIGVIAHETGHIAGGHLARMGIELEKASAQAIIGGLIGAAAAIGGGLAGNEQAARAGGGIMAGSQTLAQRGMLAYQRDMESSADQAAIRYLSATKQSPKGMLTLFQLLANESLASTVRADPYVFSHPMPLTRIRSLETAAKKSPYFDASDSPQLRMRHALMQAKLAGFLYSPQQVFNRYPASDKSPPARYARAIAAFRSGQTAEAVQIIDGLIRTIPEDPYFYELKGQALLDGGQARAALAPLAQANKLLPNNGLLQMLEAQALIATGGEAETRRAIKMLISAKRSESESPELFSQLAIGYGRIGDVPRADLATAEAAMRSGDKELAMQRAESALRQFKTGSPEWLRANDIVSFANRKK